MVLSDDSNATGNFMAKTLADDRKEFSLKKTSGYHGIVTHVLTRDIYADVQGEVKVCYIM